MLKVVVPVGGDRVDLGLGRESTRVGEKVLRKRRASGCGRRSEEEEERTLMRPSAPRTSCIDASLKSSLAFQVWDRNANRS